MLNAILSPIALPFEGLLDAVRATGAGLGVAIIAVTVLTRALFVPVAWNQARSQRVLTGLAPTVAELTDQLSGDRERLRAALVELYRANRVSPFGALLALVPQMIAFIGLYWAIADRIDAGGGFAGALAPDLSALAAGHAGGWALVVGAGAMFAGAMWLSARRIAGAIGRATMLMMVCVPVGMLGGLLVMSTGMALYLAVTAACSLAQAALLYRLIGAGTAAAATPAPAQGS